MLPALMVALAGAFASGARDAGAAGADRCAARNGGPDILIISGRVEHPEEQTDGLRRALERNHVGAGRIRMQMIDESDRSRIAAQLDPRLLSERFVIVTLSGHIAQVLSGMNLGTPTVFVTIADPLSWPIVDSLGARKANVTGITWIVDLEWKFLELLKLAFPKVRRVGVLADKYFFERGVVREMTRESVTRLGIELVPFVAESREELEGAFSGERWARVDAWLVPETPVVFRHEARVLELVRQRPVPNMFGHPSLLKKGAVLAFGVEFADMYGELARMIVLLCGGVEARQIPVVRAHRVFLGVSPTHIKAMGLDVDPRIYRLATLWH
jgi:putative tryptophan/tyrosine transport system substrate-binding protein